MTDAEIEQKIKDILVEEFECDPAKLTHDTNLFTELDLDSIDAVDLIVKLKSMLPRNINPEVFKSVRTLQDVVDAIYNLIQEPVEKK